MEKFVVGEVVVLPFPYSDQPKRTVRPALVVQVTSHGDGLICMITTQGYGDKNIVDIPGEEQDQCNLYHAGVVRYTKLTTVAPSQASRAIGSVSASFVALVQNKIAKWLTT